MSSYIHSYIEVLLNKYTITADDGSVIDAKELEACWESINRFSRLKKAELEKLCDERVMPKTGTRAHMVSRLMGLKEIPEPPTKKRKKTDPTKKSMNCPVINSIRENAKFLNVRKNQHGNYEHFETGLVFDEISETVIGKQCEDGTITQLGVEDIKLCQDNMFDYAMPSNLNAQ
jgi:hypothetical protein